MRWARRDQNVLSLKRTIRQSRINRGDNFQWFSKPAGAVFAASHIAFTGANKQDAIISQLRQIALGRRMIPHAHIHRRGHKNTLVCRQKQRGRQIIRQASSHLGQQVSRRRGHDNQVSGARQFNMAHLGLGCQIKQVLIQLFTRKRRYTKRRYKFGPCLGQNGGHFCAAFTQAPDQIKRFERRDPSANN